MKKSKLFGPFLMLFAAALASIIMVRGSYDTTEMLLILVCVMVVFYLAGNFIQKKVLSFMEEIKKKEKEEAKKEGEVIEKENAKEETEEKKQ
ncbi:MAG: hypothetical protein IKY23_07790 [Lachnospiraceae bacterium]|nr:hypothetical protein [Lachnospiraceae bacterium]